MTTYKVTGFYGKTAIDMVMSEDTLAEWRKDSLMRIESIAPCDLNIMYRTAPGCERCKTDEYVPHYNCRYDGEAPGHSLRHCTAKGCY